MKQEAILSSHYFPSIAYFMVLLQHDSVVIDLGEHFKKQSYRNRCHIYTSNGSLSLSVPVIRKNKTAVQDVVLDTTNDWKKTHWRAISSAYNSSPFFEFYEPDLKLVFFSNYTTLAELNTALLKHLFKEIGLDQNFSISTKFIEVQDAKKDYRDLIDAKKAYYKAETYARYIQIFEEKHGFIKNLSILDLLFHEGPETLNYLKNNLN